MRRWLFRFARSRLGGRLLRWGIIWMHFAIPVTRLRETPTLLAFHHPSPGYALHILILPKRSRASLLALTADDADLLRDLVSTVQNLVVELGLEAQGYRLICNGGAYQEVPLLHWHLVSGDAR